MQCNFIPLTFMNDSSTYTYIGSYVMAFMIANSPLKLVIEIISLMCPTTHYLTVPFNYLPIFSLITLNTPTPNSVVDKSKST